MIFFDWDAYRMFDLENPEPYMVRATDENKYRLGKWMATVELELRTDPFDSVEFAMKLMPDAIYVLSDGKFTDGGKTVKYVDETNKIDDPASEREYKVTFHTIGFYTNDDGTLSKMAQNNGGTYRFVPKPNANKPKRPKGNRPGMRPNRP